MTSSRGAEVAASTTAVIVKHSDPT